VDVEEILDDLRAISESPREQGVRFERLMCAFFRTDTAYYNQFKNVWMWDDWPDKWGPDTGIDLVAEHRDGSGYTAIQCKFYGKNITLDKSDIDSFFNESGKAPFTHRIIVSTTDNWTTHAENSLKNQDKPVNRVGVQALKDSSIDWDAWSANNFETLSRRPRKSLRPHQQNALDDAMNGFEEHDRGQLIMACGTGKTYTGQAIAEQVAGIGGNVLVLMPSISLLSQTLKEWTADAGVPMTPFAVCSDVKAGKRSDFEDISPYDLVLPATTDPELLVSRYKKSKPKENMTVIFSTYQSLPVTMATQDAGMPEFDLVICDEAHRTTGVTLSGADDSNFTKVHDDTNLKAKKRLYMTATARVYGDGAKAKASEADAVLASMDDPSVFGPEFHRLGFDEAVRRDLLSDYKVLVLAVDEGAVSAAFQKQLSNEDHELKLDDATRIVGCLNALAKRNAYGTTFKEGEPAMQRAVAFSNTIAQSKKFKSLFNEISDLWQGKSKVEKPFQVDVDHVDGKYNSLQREKLIRWLKDDPGDDRCHVLSNARCLTEGVDVPALDAVMFLEPRNSMVDVIQAVGRVMRKAEGKDIGYIILPVGIPADETPEQALNNNKRFKGVWQILNALRSHDERMNAVINKLDLNEEPPDMIDIVAVTIPDDEQESKDGDETEQPRQLELAFPIEELQEGIYARMVQKVGTRHYWENWAKDVAEISQKHQTRILALLEDPKLGLQSEFETFVKGLQTIINDSITEEDAVGMLSQHLVTKPVFDVLFEDYDFTASNPISVVMQDMIDLLDTHSLEKETEQLQGFYDSVKLRVEGIDNAAGKQKIVTELYEGFFSKAFPKAAESLGIVYTPIELVDFVLHATDHALRKHFNGLVISDEGVDVLDPFCGTGTFIVRLLQLGIIEPEDFKRKYKKELHSNEILLLAYYIAAINIESTYHDEIDRRGHEKTEYEPFNGIVLTDTFQMGEAGEGTGVFDVFPENNERADNQKKTTIEVIIGNPPYSAGQKSQNDDNQNFKYQRLDDSIGKTYAHLSNAVNSQNLYDSYTRAFRRASDIILSVDGGGVICFVTNGGFIDGKSFDGFRKTLAKEFHHIYIYNLRGNQRTAGEQSRKEGGKVFGSGSRATVAVTILVKESGPIPESGAIIHYRDIGDYLTREEKLEIVQSAADTNALDNIEWEMISPNKEGDWINQRSDDYQNFHTLCEPKLKDNNPQIFSLRSLGFLTGRDSWNYNFSRNSLKENNLRMIKYFNEQLELFCKEHADEGSSIKEKESLARSFINLDSKLFSWTRKTFQRFGKKEYLSNSDLSIVEVTYRPFTKVHLNTSPNINEVTGRVSEMFPPNSENLAIVFPAPGPNRIERTPFMVNQIIDIAGLGTDASHYYPLWIYESSNEESNQGSFFKDNSSGKKYAITDEILNYCNDRLNSLITKEDLFFYVYGILHHPQFLKTFGVDLIKSELKVPIIKEKDDFFIFSNAGRKLADLHTNYEIVEPYSGLDIQFSSDCDKKDPETYKVNKMVYSKNGKEIDKTSIIFNSKITINNIPISAYEFIVGQRSAIDWIVNRYQVRTNKESQILNDPNDWSREHDDPKYIFNLLRQVITVSMNTNEIVAAFPKLKFD
tara:strand:+ start:2239 stop:7074 length:4836 start_codon:yes stop_codon:yes gene_type:complete